MTVMRRRGWRTRPITMKTYSGIVKTIVVREAAATGEFSWSSSQIPKLPKKHQLLMKIAENCQWSSSVKISMLVKLIDLG